MRPKIRAGIRVVGAPGRPLPVTTPLGCEKYFFSLISYSNQKHRPTFRDFSEADVSHSADSISVLWMPRGDYLGHSPLIPPLYEINDLCKMVQDAFAKHISLSLARVIVLFRTPPWMESSKIKSSVRNARNSHVWRGCWELPCSPNYGNLK